MAVSRRLADAGLSNAGWQCDLSVSLIRLTMILARSDDVATRRSFVMEILTIAKRLAALAPTNAIQQRDLTMIKQVIPTLREEST